MSCDEVYKSISVGYWDGGTSVGQQGITCPRVLQCVLCDL